MKRHEITWRTARNLNCIGGSMKRVQEICRGWERVNLILWLEVYM